MSCFKSNLLQEIMKYVLVGGGCTIVDFALLYCMVEYASLPYIFASVISFSVGVILNYYLCSIWIFRVHKVKDKRVEFVLYAIISLFGLAINTGVIYLLTDGLHIYYLISKLLAAVFTFVWNFSARKFFLHH